MSQGWEFSVQRHLLDEKMLKLSLSGNKEKEMISRQRNRIGQGAEAWESLAGSSMCVSIRMSCRNYCFGKVVREWTVPEKTHRKRCGLCLEGRPLAR